MFPLILLLIENDEDRMFLESVYLEYHQLMYAMALKITRNGDEAQDVVSDSMMALIKKIDLLRTLPRNKLQSYIVITVKHTAINLFHQKKRRQTDDGSALENLPGNDSVDQAILARAGVEAIKNAIAALPAREKEIMLMKYFRELEDEEIAEETGLRAVSVRVHLSRARKHLSQLLEERREWL